MAAVAGLHFPVFLLLPWFLFLLGVEPAMTEALGGLRTPHAAILGGLLLVGFGLARPLPWASRVWAGLVGIAGVLAAALIPFLPGMASQIPPSILAVAALGVAALVRTVSCSSRGLAVIRSGEVLKGNPPVLRLGDGLAAIGLLLASLLITPVVLVLLPILLVVLIWRGQDSLRYASFHASLIKGWLRSLQFAPQWDVLETVHIAGEDTPRAGPFYAVPTFFAGGPEEPACAGHLILPPSEEETPLPWFLEKRSLLSRHRPQAAPAPFSAEAWMSRVSVSSGLGLRVTLDDPASPGILVIPAGYPDLPVIRHGNAPGL